MLITFQKIYLIVIFGMRIEFLKTSTLVFLGVLSASSLFSTRVGVCVDVCVCIRTHTHTLYSDVSPLGMRHLMGPKNPDGLNLGIHIFVYVYKVHMCNDDVCFYQFQQLFSALD